MPMVWSQLQVRAGRKRVVIETFKDRHLPWCRSISEDCSCFGKTREKMLNTFAEAVAIDNRTANDMYMKVIYGI